MQTSPTEFDLRRVLTIRQPWAFLIIRPDLPAGSPERQEWLASPLRKDVENRKTMHSYRGELHIHAGLQVDEAAKQDLWRSFPEIGPALAAWNASHDQRGGIIGKVRMTDSVRAHPSLWFGGPVGWVLEEPEILPFEKLRGMQGIYRAGDVPLTNAQLADRIQKEGDSVRGRIASMMQPSRKRNAVFFKQ